MTPTECRTFLAEMIRGGRVDLAIQEKLEKTQSRIDPVLVEAMLEYPDPLLREAAATILGERRNPKAIPALLRALRDSSEHVRFDALVAIEKCTGLDPATLGIALRLDPRRPKQAVARVEAWWEIVRKDL
jgi:HEAT repeat protein